MLGLRIFLGVTLGLAASGYLGLAMFASGFRRSFGASSRNAALVFAPLAAMAVLLAALICVTVLPLLHVAAGMAIVLALLCTWQIATQAAQVLWLALAWLALWFVFYARAAWGLGAE